MTTDLVTDQRVHKVCTSLFDAGYDIVLVGRVKKNSLPLNKRKYNVVRFNLIFEKGFLFYLNFNCRLFLFLIVNKADILVANDLDTLLPNYLASKLKRIPIAYDNHEYFTGVPELVNRPFVRSVWKKIERFIFPKLKFIYTENESKRKLYEEEYNVPLSVVRNLPVFASDKVESIKRPDWIGNRKVILYQGAVNKDRGLEEMVSAMAYLDEFVLLIIGSGDVFSAIKEKVVTLKLMDRIYLYGQLPFEELPSYTAIADVGISIEKDTNISYRYCLPNKIFDYINAGVPVLASSLLEMKSIVEHYNVGIVLTSHQPIDIANTIKKMFSDESKIQYWKDNCNKASKQLNWGIEEKVLLDLYSKIK